MDLADLWTTIQRSLVDLDGAVDPLDEGVGRPEADGARQKPECDHDDGSVAAENGEHVRWGE